MSLLGEQYRVLVAEQIADSGVDLLRERFAVDVGTGWSPDELRQVALLAITTLGWSGAVTAYCWINDVLDPTKTPGNP